MKKSEVKNFANGIIDKMKALKTNKINDDQKTIIDEVIKGIEEKVSELDAVEDDVDNEKLFKEVTDKITSMFEAYLEKDVTEETENSKRMKAQNYLGSAEATHDFLQVIRNSENSKAFNAQWGKKLSENGVTGDLKLPEAVHTAIQDAW